MKRPFDATELADARFARPASWPVHETGLVPPTPPSAEDAEKERVEIAAHLESLQGPTPEDFDEYFQEVPADVEPPGSQAAATRTFRRVYTVTFSHGVEGKAQPDNFSREEFAALYCQTFRPALVRPSVTGLLLTLACLLSCPWPKRKPPCPKKIWQNVS